MGVKKPSYYDLEQKIAKLEVELKGLKNLHEKKLLEQLNGQYSNESVKNELLKSELKFRALFEQAGGYCMILDPNTTNGIPIIIDANEAACQIHGYSREQFIGRPVADIDDAEGKKLVKERTALIMTGQPFYVENVHVRKNGTSFPVAVSANRIDIAGEPSLIFTTEYDISEQKKTELELKLAKEKAEESQAQYELIADYTYDWETYYNIKGEIIYVNQAFEKITGYQKEDFQSKKIDWKELVHEDDLFELEFTMANIFLGETIDNFEFRVYHKKGPVVYVELCAQPVYGVTKQLKGLRTSIRDVSERKRAEISLKEQQIVFETMFNTITEGVVITDTQRNIILANKGMLKTFGYKSEEIIGKSTQVLYAAEDHFDRTGDAVFNKEAAASKDHYMVYYRDKANVVFPGETFGAKLYNNSGEWIGNIGIMRNVSERLRFIEDLQIAKDKAEESDRLKSEFINNLSHEIRTPMNGILGFSELLVDDDIPNVDRAGYAEIIHNSGNQLLRVIDDLLEISRLGAKQSKELDTTFNLNHLLNHLFSIFEQRSKDSPVFLKLEKGFLDEESKIISDESKLNKILSNLIENALKFTFNGFVKFGYRLMDNGEPAEIEFYVQDTGVGIKENYQKIIFDRFSQEEKEISIKSGGLGLGLSIVKENVEIMGGTISLESEKGKGTTFFVRLPYRTATQ